jgi:hypothetical protein
MSRAFAARIQDVTFSKTGDVLSVVDESGAISVLTIDGELVTSRRAFFQGSQRQSVAFSPDGEWLGVLAEVSGRGVLHLVRVDPESLDSLLCEKVIRSPTPQEWRTLVPADDPPSHCSSRIEPQ